MRHSHDWAQSEAYEASAGATRTSVLNIPQTKEHSLALVIIIPETICHMTALLSVTSAKAVLGFCLFTATVSRNSHKRVTDIADGAAVWGITSVI
jgi:hypothetical protein